jgi:hypothetical protein
MTYAISFQSNVNVCDINEDVKEAVKKFRFRKSETNAALIRKYLTNISVKCPNVEMC